VSQGSQMCVVISVLALIVSQGSQMCVVISVLALIVSQATQGLMQSLRKQRKVQTRLYFDASDITWQIPATAMSLATCCVRCVRCIKPCVACVRHVVLRA